MGDRDDRRGRLGDSLLQAHLPTNQGAYLGDVSRLADVLWQTGPVVLVEKVVTGGCQQPAQHALLPAKRAVGRLQVAGAGR